MRDASPRLVGVVGASCLMAGWLLGSTLNPPVAHTQAPPAPRLAPEAALPRLDIPSVAERRERLVVASDAPSPVRNPFVFGGVRAAARHAATAPPVAHVEAPVVVEPPVAPPPPAWTLVGIALDEGGDREHVTAILSNGMDVQLATAGVALAGGYTVVRVAPDHVVLQDGSGTESVVRLP